MLIHGQHIVPHLPHFFLKKSPLPWLLKWPKICLQAGRFCAWGASLHVPKRKSGACCVASKGRGWFMKIQAGHWIWRFFKFNPFFQHGGKVPTQKFLSQVWQFFGRNPWHVTCTSFHDNLATSLSWKQSNCFTFFPLQAAPKGRSSWSVVGGTWYRKSREDVFQSTYYFKGALFSAIALACAGIACTGTKPELSARDPAMGSAALGVTRADSSKVAVPKTCFFAFLSGHFVRWNRTSAKYSHCQESTQWFSRRQGRSIPSGGSCSEQRLHRHHRPESGKQMEVWKAGPWAPNQYLTMPRNMLLTLIVLVGSWLQIYMYGLYTFHVTNTCICLGSEIWYYICILYIYIHHTSFTSSWKVRILVEPRLLRAIMSHPCPDLKPINRWLVGSSSRSLGA